MHLLLNHLRAERLLLLGRRLPLLLEEVNGERDFAARSSAYAEVVVAGLNQLAGCPVIPRRVLVEQRAEFTQRPCQPLTGVRGTDLSLVVRGIMQIAALVVVQKEDVTDMTSACRAERVPASAPDGGALAAGVERVADSLVRLGLLGGLDGTSLQVVHSEWDVFCGLEGLPCDCFGVCVRGFVGLKGLDELHGGSGLHGLHGLLADLECLCLASL